MSWDNVLMAFVDKMVADGVSRDDQDFFITRNDVVAFTGLSCTAVSHNLSLCVKNGWLRREESRYSGGREVRYYLNNKELFAFVDKYLGL